MPDRVSLEPVAGDPAAAAYPFRIHAAGRADSRKARRRRSRLARPRHSTLPLALIGALVVRQPAMVLVTCTDRESMKFKVRPSAHISG